MSGVAAWSAFGVFFALFSGLVLALVRAEVAVLREHVDGLRNELVERIDGLRRETTVRFDALDRRLDDHLAADRDQRREEPAA
jgi:hypothetical protein